MSNKLAVTFSMIDKVSEAFNRMADEGDKLLDKLNNIGRTADSTMGTVAQSATSTAQSAKTAASSVDTWTAAVGNYDKSAMEAIYSTQELVDMGYKTEQALSNEAAAVKKTTISMDEANSAAKEFRLTIEQQEIELKELQNAYVGVALKLGTSSDQAQALKSDISALTGTLEGNRKELSSLEGQVKDTGDQSKNFGKNSVDAVTSLQNVLVATGVGIAVRQIANEFMAASEAAAKFETAVDQISTVADTSKVSMAEMNGELLDASNYMGQNVNDLSEAVYNAISSSVDTAAAVAFASTSTELAVGGFTNATTAVDVLTTTINAYGLAASDAAKISDMLITTQNLGKTTVNELASSVGKVIPLAAAYNVEMDNLSTAYAILTNNGIATAEAGTYMKAMLTELADSGSAVAKTLKEETGNTFSDLMEQGYSLGDVLQVLGDSVDGNKTAFSNLWGSTEAGTGALSMFNAGAEKFNGVLLDMQNSAGATSNAFKAMSDNTEYTEQRLNTAAENFGITVGNVLNPALNNLRGLGTDVLIWMTDVVEKHPAIAAAAAGLTAGVTALTVVLGIYEAKQTIAAIKTTASAVAHTANAVAAGVDAVATTGAAVATEGFTAALLANPVGLIVAGVAALAVGLGVLISKMNETEDEYYSLTATSKKQYDELQALNAEYENACDVYGETSYVSQKLRWQIDDLTAEYESGKQTLEEYNEQFEKTIKSHNDLMTDYDDSMAKINQEADSTSALIVKLEELATQSVQTAITQEQIHAIIDRLNETLPELSLKYEDVISNSSDFIESLKTMAEAEAAQRRYNEAYNSYVDMLTDEATLKSRLDDANKKATAAQEQYNEANQKYIDKLNLLSKGDPTGAAVAMMFSEEQKAVDSASKALEDHTIKVAEAQTAYDENIAKQQEAINTMSEYANAQDTSAEATEDYASAVETGYMAAETSIASVNEELENLAAAYDKAYESAYDSISGTVGMFQSMKTEVKITTDEMLANMLSQQEFINNYTNNLEYAAQYLSEGLIASLSDGSEESASYLQTLVNQLKRAEDGLSWTYGSAEEFADKMNAAYSGVEQAKDRFSGYVANMETDFGNSMDKIEEKLAESISDMDLSANAADAAQATIQAYISTIESMTGSAHDAAAALAAAVLAAMNPGLGAGSSFGSSTSSVISVPVKAHATGTKNAENAFIAGENGPELILGAEGSTVYTAEETERMFSNTVNNYSSFSVNAPVPSNLELSAQGNSPDRSVQDKKITLAIEGHGNISIDKSMSKNEIIEILYDNLRPALQNVLDEELFQGGDSAYEY